MENVSYFDILFWEASCQLFILAKELKVIRATLKKT